MRILIVSPYLPHRAVGHGGGNAIFHMALALATEHEVRVLCFRRSDEAGREADLESAGIRVDAVDYRSGADRGVARVITALDRAPRLLLAAITGRPYRSLRYAHRGLSRRLEQIVREWNPDAVQCEYFAMAPYARRLRQARSGSKPCIALSTHEVETLVRMRKLFAAAGAWPRLRADWRLRRIRAFESAASSWADRVLCVTDQDAEILRGLSGEPEIHTLPLGVRLEALPRAQEAAAGPPRFLFMGSFDHPPNREAARWLARAFVPWMLHTHPGAVLEVVGRNPESSLVQRAQRSAGTLLVHGFVEELDPLFDRASIFVAPLSSGGGIKIKVLEAMGRGVPVLTTPIGLDGIAAQRGVECACAEPGAAFLEECERLLSQPGDLAAMGARGRAFIARQHDWPALSRKLVSLLSGVPGNTERADAIAPAPPRSRGPEGH